jgi:hypothetical protein
MCHRNFNKSYIVKSLSESQRTTVILTKATYEASTKLRCHCDFVRLTVIPNMHQVYKEQKTKKWKIKVLTKVLNSN